MRERRGRVAALGRLGVLSLVVVTDRRLLADDAGAGRTWMLASSMPAPRAPPPDPQIALSERRPRRGNSPVQVPVQVAIQVPVKVRVPGRVHVPGVTSVSRHQRWGAS
jgi:hypothetical protein